MIEKRNTLCKNMVNMYFWSTMCGIPFLILSYPIAMALLAFGANSFYIALCYSGFEEYMPLVRFCGCWLIGFPVVLILAYILAIRKRWYIPFLVLVLADTVFVCLASALELSRDNVHGVVMVLMDIIISIVICFVFIAVIHSYRKELKKSNLQEET